MVLVQFSLQVIQVFQDTTSLIFTKKVGCDEKWMQFLTISLTSQYCKD